ncbi:MAG: Conserved repeat domain protein [Candidatus Uhrbacteria bacterium GW2011_GWD2_52_7]|uniref:Conserved repeat domain protein n=1 Tax=Candidatus Uhrbacteria bacterium GW2011_GWD2_52_7 TaxID=1618989 RepID=A0A0G1XGX3_9BACT|nr:MAG: Conserved repeat domain protein [Candidatus Uhrbacteria bacterium GW2011_GWD2_52_7]
MHWLQHHRLFSFVAVTIIVGTSAQLSATSWLHVKQPHEIRLDFTNPDIATYPVEDVTFTIDGVSPLHANDTITAIVRPILLPKGALLRSLAETSTVPNGTSIGYQVTTDFREWKYFDGKMWATADCEDCYTPATLLVDNLAQLVNGTHSFAFKVQLKSSAITSPKLTSLKAVFFVDEQINSAPLRAAAKPSSDWDGSDLRADGRCLDPLIEFTITNTAETGVGDMTSVTEYRVFRNDSLESSGAVQLAGGASMTVDVAADAQDVTLEVDQHPGHPGNNIERTTVRHCGGGVPPQPPVAEDDILETDVNTPATLEPRANDSDPDSNLNQTTIILTSQPLHGSTELDPNNKYITYTPTTNFSGTDTFIYQLCDTDNLCDNATVNVTVHDSPNLPPIANDDIANVEQGSNVQIYILANDIDPEDQLNKDSLAVTPGSGPSNGTAEALPNGRILYNPDPAFVGFDIFIYSICDLQGLCDSATVTVNVSYTNLPPVAADDNATATSGRSVTIPVLANDSDPDGILNYNSLTIAIHPANGTADVDTSTGSIIYTSTVRFFGDETFSYQICDDDGACAEAQVTISVTLALAPTLLDDNAVSPRGAIISIPVLANDQPGTGEFDMTTVTSTPSEKLAMITFDNNTSAFIYQPLQGYVGKDTFAYSICNTIALCATANVQITMISRSSPLNYSPIAQADDAQSIQGEPITLSVLANDSDPDGTLGAIPTIQILPTYGTAIINTDGTITYVSFPDAWGTDTFTYSVCDTTGLCAQAQVSILVLAPPKAQEDAFIAIAGIPKVLDVLANDIDPDGEHAVLTARLVTQPIHGSITSAFAYTPEEGFSGYDQLTYEVCDIDGLCDQGIAVITVDARALPLAQDDEVTITSSAVVVIPVLLNDLDPDGTLDPRTLTIIEPSQSASFILDDAVVYTPNTMLTNDSLSYSVCDNDGLCDIARVLFTYSLPSDHQSPVMPTEELLPLPEISLQPFETAPVEGFTMTNICSDIPTHETIVVQGLIQSKKPVLAIEYSINGGFSWNPIPTTSSLRDSIKYTIPNVASGSYPVMLRAHDGSTYSASTPCTQAVTSNIAIGAGIFTSNDQLHGYQTEGTSVFEQHIPHVFFLEASGADQVVLHDTTTDRTYPLAYIPELKLWLGEVVVDELGTHHFTVTAANASDTISREFMAVEIVPTISIVDANIHEALDNVKVTIDRREGTKFIQWDAGTFGIKNPTTTDKEFIVRLPGGQYVITFSKPGYHDTVTEVITISNVTLLQGTVELTPANSWVDELRAVAGITKPSISLMASYGTLTANKPTQHPITTQTVPVLYAVMTTWDVESQEQSIALEEIAGIYNDKIRVEVKGVLEPPSVIERWLDRGNYHFNATPLTNEEVQYFNVSEVPSLYLYSADGLPAGTLKGAHTSEEIQSWITSSLQ